MIVQRRKRQPQTNTIVRSFFISNVLEIQPIIHPVQSIANNRKSKRTKRGANLMLASGVKASAQQTQRAFLGVVNKSQASELGVCENFLRRSEKSAEFLLGREFSFLANGTGGVGGERALGVEPGGEVAFDESQVFFVDGAGLEGCLERGGGGGIVGEQEQAAGFAVEAVGEMAAEVGAEAGFEQRVERVLGVDAGGVDGQVGGFVDQGDVGVLEQDLVVGGDGRFGLGLKGELDLLAGADAIGGTGFFLFEQNLAGFDALAPGLAV